MTEQYTVKTTIFGGSRDYETSAYDGHVITDNELAAALPARFNNPPKVRVYYGEKFVICQIVDVGPWNTDDPYWETNARPQAETGHDKSGRKTNGAGMDISVAAANGLGIQGDGIVSWEFV